MSKRGVYRGVYCSLVDSLADEGLSPDARHVLLTARLSKEAGPASIFRCYPVRLAEQTGRPMKVVERALGELRDRGWIEREGPVVWIKNGLRYDPTIRLADKKHLAGVQRAIAELPRLQIVLRFCDYYQITRPFGDLSKTSPDLDASGPPRPKKTEEDRVPKKTEVREKLGRPVLADDTFLAALRSNVAYQHLDLEVELGKMDAWLLTPKGQRRQKTRAFVVAWLNRCERPLPAGAHSSAPTVAAGRTIANAGVFERAIARTPR